MFRRGQVSLTDCYEGCNVDTNQLCSCHQRYCVHQPARGTARYENKQHTAQHSMCQLMQNTQLN